MVQRRKRMHRPATAAISPSFLNVCIDLGKVRLVCAGFDHYQNKTASSADILTFISTDGKGERFQTEIPHRFVAHAIC
jgi:hypothetical protein